MGWLGLLAICGLLGPWGICISIFMHVTYCVMVHVTGVLFSCFWACHVYCVLYHIRLCHCVAYVLDVLLVH